MQSISKFVSLLVLFLKILYNLIKLAFNPNNLYPLLKIGNLLDKMKFYEVILNKIKLDPQALKLIHEKYMKQIPTMNELEKYPVDTLGYSYWLHMSKNNLSFYPRTFMIDTESKYLRERQRHIHDILHTVFDLGIDQVSEIKINAIMFGNGAAPISVIVVAIGLLHFIFKNPENFLNLSDQVFAGYSIGKSSKSVFAFKWEEMLDLNIYDVRQMLILKTL